MPGFDGTGPGGQGAFTGGGRGYCADYFVPGRGIGRGYGRGRGFGRGFGRRRAVSPYDYGTHYGVPYRGEPAIAPRDEARGLREQAKAMREEVKAINERIKELESSAGSEGNE